MHNDVKLRRIYGLIQYKVPLSLRDILMILLTHVGKICYQSKLQAQCVKMERAKFHRFVIAHIFVLTSRRSASSTVAGDKTPP